MADDSITLDTSQIEASLERVGNLINKVVINTGKMANLLANASTKLSSSLTTNTTKANQTAKALSNIGAEVDKVNKKKLYISTDVSRLFKSQKLTSNPDLGKANTFTKIAFDLSAALDKSGVSAKQFHNAVKDAGDDILLMAKNLNLTEEEFNDLIPLVMRYRKAVQDASKVKLDPIKPNKTRSVNYIFAKEGLLSAPNEKLASRLSDFAPKLNLALTKANVTGKEFIEIMQRAGKASNLTPANLGITKKKFQELFPVINKYRSLLQDARRDIDKLNNAQFKNAISQRGVQTAKVASGIISRDKGVSENVIRAQQRYINLIEKTGVSLAQLQHIENAYNKGARFANNKKVNALLQGFGGVVRATDADHLKKMEAHARNIDKYMFNTRSSLQIIGSIITSQMITSSFSRFLMTLGEANRQLFSLQKQVSAIRTLSRDAAKSQQTWISEIQNLAAESGFAVEDISSAVYETLGNQIAKGGTAIEFVREATELARVSNSSLASTVNLLSSAVNSYGFETAKAMDIAAQAQRARDLGRFQMEDISETIGRVLPTAKLLGVSFAEVMGVLAVMNQKGIPISEAMTLLNNVFIKLLRPTKEMSAAFDEFGVTSGQMLLSQRGLVGALSDIAVLAEKGGDTFADLAAIYGRIRAMRGGLPFSDPKTVSDTEKAIYSIENYSESYKKLIDISKESDAFKIGKGFQNFMSGLQKNVSGKVFKELAQGFENVDFSKINTQLYQLGSLLAGATKVAIIMAPHVFTLTKALVGFYVLKKVHGVLSLVSHGLAAQVEVLRRYNTTVSLFSTRGAKDVGFFASSFELLGTRVGNAGKAFRAFAFSASGASLGLTALIAIIGIVAERLMNARQEAQRYMDVLKELQQQEEDFFKDNTDIKNEEDRTAQTKAYVKELEKLNRTLNESISPFVKRNKLLKEEASFTLGEKEKLYGKSLEDLNNKLKKYVNELERNKDLIENALKAIDDAISEETGFSGKEYKLGFSLLTNNEQLALLEEQLRKIQAFNPTSLDEVKDKYAEIKGLKEDILDLRVKTRELTPEEISVAVKKAKEEAIADRENYVSALKILRENKNKELEQNAIKLQEAQRRTEEITTDLTKLSSLSITVLSEASKLYEGLKGVLEKNIEYFDKIEGGKNLKATFEQTVGLAKEASTQRDITPQLAKLNETLEQSNKYFNMMADSNIVDINSGKEAMDKLANFLRNQAKTLEPLDLRINDVQDYSKLLPILRRDQQLGLLLDKYTGDVDAMYRGLSKDLEAAVSRQDGTVAKEIVDLTNRLSKFLEERDISGASGLRRATSLEDYTKFFEALQSKVDIQGNQKIFKTEAKKILLEGEKALEGAKTDVEARDVTEKYSTSVIELMKEFRKNMGEPVNIKIDAEFNINNNSDIEDVGDKVTKVVMDKIKAASGMNVRGYGFTPA